MSDETANIAAQMEQARRDRKKREAESLAMNTKQPTANTSDTAPIPLPSAGEGDK